MNRSPRFIAGVFMGSLYMTVLVVGRAWPGFLDGSEKMPPPPKTAPNALIAPERQTLMDGDYRVVSFHTLGGFPFKPADDIAMQHGRHIHDWEAHVPDDVKDLKGKKVTVQGFMMPVDMDLEHKIVKSFVLVPHLMSCCFGGSPIMNMWIFVSTDKRTQNDMDFDEPTKIVRVYGTLDVEEKLDDDVGHSLYRLKADRLIQPKHPDL